MLLKMGVRICPSFWYQMDFFRVLAHGLIANGADRRKLTQIKALMVTCRKIPHIVSFIKFHRNSASHIVTDFRGEGIC